jgi:putative CocE/NonD family hydrolase
MRRPTLLRPVSISVVAVTLVMTIVLASAPSQMIAQTAPSAGGLSEADVYRQVGYITLADKVRLAYITYRPKKEGRFPTLLEFSPYSVDGAQFAAVKNYLDHGYEYVGVDIRGTSCSEGKLSMFDPVLADDGAQVVEWVGSRPSSTGSVGMIGNSYPGHTQIFTAAKRPKYLKAIAPGALTASSYREAWRPAGIFNVSFIGGWAFAPRGSDAMEARKKWGDTECEAIRAKQPPNGTFYEVLEHPLHDEWWRARDLETYIGDITVPTLMIQAWQDHQTQISGALHLFRGLKSQNKRIIIQPGGHGVYRRPITQVEVLRWMDHWLKGEQNGVEKEDPITVWWEVHDVNGKLTPNWTSSYPTWPAPNTKWVSFSLSPDGQLNTIQTGNAEGNGARSYTYPIGTELVGNNVQFAMPPNPAGVLTYRTAPMTEDTTILGYPQLTFYLSSEQKDTDIMVTLHDIDENGDSLYLQRDFLRASLRAIDPARSTEDEVYRTFNKAEQLVPGQIYEMKLSIPPVGHVLRKGHKLELSIMAPSVIGQPNWGLMILDMPGRNTVYDSAKYPSTLKLPIIEGAKAQAAAPECGSMEFQPCRHAPRPAVVAGNR